MDQGVSALEKDNPSKTIEQALLVLLAEQGSRVVIPVTLMLAVVAGMASSYVSPFIAIGWVAIVFGVMMWRRAALRRLAFESDKPDYERLRSSVIVTLINGCSHGASLLFFPFFSDFERGVQTIIFVGMSAFSVMTTAGYRPVSLAYNACTVLPLSLMWAIHPGSDTTWVHYTLAAGGVMFTVFFVVISATTFDTFKRAFELSQLRERLNQQLKTALSESEKSSRAKSRFLASASHDLRQPIHTLSLFSGALSKRSMDDSMREITGFMDEAIKNLATQLDALLDVSKLDAGVVQVNRQVMPLRPFLERMQQEYAPRAREKGLDLLLECSTDGYVDTDPILFERIYRNLLDNAIKYTDEGRVKVSIDSSGSQWLISISDTGRGIPLEDRERIFEEFYQLDNPERDRTKGLGLGLAIVKRLSPLLGIDVDLSSMHPRGTEFSLRVPRTLGTATPLSAANDKLSIVDTFTVLVVDDEVGVRMGMRSLLESLDCEVLLADSTESAKQLVYQDRPDLVLADFRLRGKDNGILTIQALRELHPDLPAILISGDTSAERLRAVADAELEILHKPVLAHDLEIAIARYIKKPINHEGSDDANHTRKYDTDTY